MMTSFLLAVSLSLTTAQTPAAINLTNVRSTYGELGGPRPLAPFTPGDVMFIGFDIEGITNDEQGRVQYSMGMELFDAAGASKYKNEPTNKIDFVPLGGNKIPGRAYTTIGLDQAAGDYMLKVTVTDLATKATKTLEQKFTVAPKDFAIVAVYTTIDERGQIPVPTTGIVGQAMFVQLGIVGFTRAADKKAPNVEVEMMPLDEKGNPTIAKPSILPITSGVDEKDAGVTIRYLLPLTRTGKYSVRLKATDKLTGKVSTFVLPVTILPNN
jgi:hypothetical protein